MVGNFGTTPFAEKKFLEIRGKRMAYIDEGEGDAIIFQHGNPTSSYLWRNVMPHLRGLGRLVACDLIGMGDSEKLSPSDAGSYHYEEQREYLFGLWDELALGNRVTLVIHDWGSALGFDWAIQNPGRVKGIAYMEGVVAPLQWADFDDQKRAMFEAFRSDAGDMLVLEQNAFIEQLLPAVIQRQLSAAEMDEYRRPYVRPGEDRRPTLSWPRNIPIENEPASVVQTVESYGRFMASSDIPKLFINAEPGSFLIGRFREFCRSWPNQTEVIVNGLHFVQEDSPDEIGKAVADFVKRLQSE